MRLETARLVIRSFEAHDADPWIALVNDSEVGRFTPPSPPATLETFHGALARRQTMERERGYAMWAVDLKGTDSFIGQCGVYPAEGKGPEVELAYHYAPAIWGHGYATEAAIAVLTYAFGSLRLDQVIALVMPENVVAGGGEGRHAPGGDRDLLRSRGPAQVLRRPRRVECAAVGVGREAPGLSKLPVICPQELR